MFTLICENSRGQQLNLTRHRYYVVTSVEGLTPPSASINTTKVALGDGAIFNSSVVNERNIVIGLYIVGDVEYYRQQLYKIFKVKQFCKVYYQNTHRNVYIEGYVESFEASIFDMKQYVQISIICPSAYFTNVDDKEYEFSWTNGGFEFPFSIPESGVEFGTIANTSTVDVINDGDVDTGLTIELSARGRVLNPTLINVQTGEQMVINYELEAGDVVKITTHRGNKRITRTHDGVTENIINRLKTGSTWFSVAVGDNVFAYSADSGGSVLDVKFILSELYEGV